MDVLPEGKQEFLSDDNTEDRDVIVEDEKDISIDDHDESTQATPPPSPNEEDQDTDVNTKDDDDFDDLMEVLSDSEIDIENLEEKDPDEIERQRQALLEKKNKILEMMKENFGSEELLQLGVNIEEEDLETRKRGKARRSSYDLSPISTPSSDSRKRRGRPKKMYKKDEYDEGDDLIYDDGRVSYSTPSDNKRGRTTWSLSENKQLLDILQRGVTETQAIFDDMAKYYGSRKSFEHIKNKRSNLLQKATSRNTTMIEILKEDITKMEEQGRPQLSSTRRFSRDAISVTSPLSSGNLSRDEYEELKNLILSGFAETQKQIALLRRDFAKSQGHSIPDDVQDILADYNDELTKDEPEVSPAQPERVTPHLVIKTNNTQSES